jgi:hypothetical protein
MMIGTEFVLQIVIKNMRRQKMPITKIYNTWKMQIRQLQPNERITRIQNFAWLISGIYQSRSVTLTRISGKIPMSAKLLSTVRRMSRLLSNPRIQVRKWYEPIARQWLETQFCHKGEIHLVVDGTKIGCRHQLLIVCLPYHKRAIPIAWTWVKHVKGHSTARKHLALMSYVHTLIPPNAAVFLLGDTEFGSVMVMHQLETWRWFFVLRQKTNTGVWINEESGWKTFGSYIQKPKDSIWLGHGYITKKDMFPVNMLVHWKVGEKDPWCLATNLIDRQVALRLYKRRMWIEEMFGDMKKHGFDLERTMLRHFLRLSRLTLAVAILYVWLVSVGTKTIRSGLRHLVDRKDRRDLCIFQIGLRYIERCLNNDLSVQFSLCSYR